MAAIIESNNFVYFAVPHVPHCNAQSLWWGTQKCAIEYSRHWASSGCTLLTRAELSRHRASPRPTWSTCTCLDSSPRLNTRIGSNHAKCNHLLEQSAALQANSSSSALDRWYEGGNNWVHQFVYFAVPHVYRNAQSLWRGTRTCASEISGHWASSGITLVTMAEFSLHRASPSPTRSTCTCLDSSPRLNTCRRLSSIKHSNLALRSWTDQLILRPGSCYPAHPTKLVSRDLSLACLSINFQSCFSSEISKFVTSSHWR